MTRLKMFAFTAGLFVGILTFGHGSNVAEAKTAYLKMNTKGKVAVKYDHGDSYSLDVYVPPCSPCHRHYYAERLDYFSSPNYLGRPPCCVFTSTHSDIEPFVTSAPKIAADRPARRRQPLGWDPVRRPHVVVSGMPHGGRL